MRVYIYTAVSKPITPDDKIIIEKGVPYVFYEDNPEIKVKAGELAFESSHYIDDVQILSTGDGTVIPIEIDCDTCLLCEGYKMINDSPCQKCVA